MDRSEPSFIPGWLKGTAGSGLATQNSSDEGGFSKAKVNHNLLAVGNNVESPRKSAPSSKSFSSSLRRSHNNGTADRPISERGHCGLVRSKLNLNRSSSIRSQSKLNLEQNGYKSWLDGEAGLEGDRRKDWLSGMLPDGKEREREFGESARHQLSPRSPSANHDIASKLKRSQSMSMSSRLECGPGKLTEGASLMPSLNGNSTNNLQKMVIEDNLGLDDRPSSPHLSIRNLVGPCPSLANSHHVWQGSSQSDLSRASSPGLVGGGFVSLMPASISPSTAGNDIWSSALADGPTSNGIVHSRIVASNTANLPSLSQTSASAADSLGTSVTPLNMAEALTQNPPRVRTPPQVSVESQRLEELALKQSRQLIPVTPSLRKIMSLPDKGKSKTPRAGDMSTTNLKSQLNPMQKLASQSSRLLDTMKPSQGKLCVLRPGKDGVVVSAASKSDGTAIVPPQMAGQGNSSIIAGVLANGGHGLLKQGRAAPALQGASISDRLRVKDSMVLDDRRLSLHAQNRSAFFNTLRKKAAAGNGVNGGGLNSSVCKGKNETVDDINAKGQGNGGQVKEDAGVRSCSGDFLSCESSKEDGRHLGLPMVELNEEETAFMRSLGWEENAEGSELTEEEINAFYESLQASQREKLLNGKPHYSYRACRVEHVAVGSRGSMSSGFSSSDSDADDVVPA